MGVMGPGSRRPPSSSSALLPRLLAAALLLVTLAAAPGAGCTPRFRRRFHELQLQDALRHRENERQHRELLDLLPARLQQRMVEEAERARAEQQDEQDGGDQVGAEAEGETTGNGDSDPPGVEGFLTAREMMAAASRLIQDRQSRGATGSMADMFSDKALEEIVDGLDSGRLDPATFNPTPFAQGSPEYQQAMINFLLKMSERGHDIQSAIIDKPLTEIYKSLQDSKSDGRKDPPLICRTVPYNVCYRLDKNGRLKPIGNRRPVRILRVYKKK